MKINYYDINSKGHGIYPLCIGTYKASDCIAKSNDICEQLDTIKKKLLYKCNV